MRARRTPVLVVLVLLLAAGGVADRTARSRAAVPAAAARRAVMPSAAPAGALSSSWFCVGATGGAGTPADGVVEVANPTERAVTGTLTAVPADGQPAHAPLSVPAYGVTAVALRDVAAGPWVAAVVDVDSGQVGAELVVSGGSESDATPCASRASEHFWFADGVTAKDASLNLSLFNPFPEDAIVDLAFSTDQGPAAPAAFRPIVVPARSLVVRDVGEHVRRRNAVATEVSVRTGRVVAAQTQVRTAPGRAGLSVTLGSPSLGSTWRFAEGAVADGVAEHYAVANPGRREVTVLFQVIVDEGVVEDFERSVPAGDRLDVVLDEQVGVPRGMHHSTTVTSLDGPVVVDRTLEYAAPSPYAGRAETLGARRAATRWLFAAGTPGTAGDESLVVANTGSRQAHVSVAALAGTARPIAGLEDVVVGAGKRATIPLDDHVTTDGLAVVVSSTVPVVVERTQFFSGGGAWAGPGIPLE